MAQFEFWFDISCPYAYLASTRIEYLEARTGAAAKPMPFLLGGVFTALEVPQNLMSALSPAKARHNANDLARHARAFDVPYEMPAEHPRRTVDALRALLGVSEADRFPLAHALFRAYWAEGKDLSQRDVLGGVVGAAGLDTSAVMARIDAPEIKSELRARTETALEKGVFGAPAFFVNDELYYGADRIYMVERALGSEPTSPLPEISPSRLRPVEMWFDYSSPFAYIGVNAAMRAIRPALRLRPMLLGAVFKAVEQANVPMSTFSDSKRRYFLQDLHRQAEQAGIPFSFPTRFPMNTVTALRMTLAAMTVEDDVWPLVERIYRAFWSEDLDISDRSVLSALADEVDFDGADLLEMASAPDIKQALFTATEAAVAEGVFGAPTFVVTRSDGQKSLYWGADRLPLAAQAAAGHAAVY